MSPFERLTRLLTPTTLKEAASRAMPGLHAGASASPRRDKRIALTFVGFVSIVVFARTACPTITWWDSSPHSLAAVTLGITTPPGSLLLTLAGWMVTRLLPSGLPSAHVLNLLAGVLAAITVMLVLLITLRLLQYSGDVEGAGADHGFGAAVAGAALGALTFAFSETFWQYAVQFTPYLLTTVFTGLIIWSMLRWWESAAHPDSWRWLLLLGLLFGLDFSVHRTNLLLLPCLFLWILLRRPVTLLTARAWISGAGGMIVGLAFHLLLIPIAASGPPLNAGDPSSWSRFYEYVSLAQFGGGWLVQFYPRNAALWSVQVMDALRAFSSNFLWVTGRVGMAGILPALFGALGLFFLRQRNRRLAIAFTVLLLLHAVVTIAYFNIPANFVRSLNRHYLPVFVTWAVLMAYGMTGTLARLQALSWSTGRRATGLAVALLALVPLSQLIRNWTASDGSKRHFTEDYAANALNGLPRNAILYTSGDNDTWPLVYLHVVAHVRPDVQVVNLSLSNTNWYMDQVQRSDPSFPLSRGRQDDLSLSRPWTDTTLILPIVGRSSEFGLPDDLALRDSIVVHATPTMEDKYVLRQDLVLLHILENNRWQRPLCFSTTVGEQSLTWLKPYLRLDGLFWRLVPLEDPSVNREILRKNLLQTYAYRGYAESDLPLDEVSRAVGGQYYRALVATAQADLDAGERDRCRDTREAALRLLPVARLRPDSTLRRALERLCMPSSAVPSLAFAR